MGGVRTPPWFWWEWWEWEWWEWEWWVVENGEMDEEKAEAEVRLGGRVWLRVREGGLVEEDLEGVGEEALGSDLRHWTYLRATEWRSQETPVGLKTWATRVVSSVGIRGWT
jgi:hypothetical protein